MRPAGRREVLLRRNPVGTGTALRWTALLVAAVALGGCGTAKPVFRNVPGLPPESRPAGAPEPAPAVPSSKVEQVAQPWLGVPYRYGGTGRKGIDCSAFTREVMGDLGADLPRTVRDQRMKGRPVDPSDLAPGDLVFFRLDSGDVNHVGVAVDGNRFVHASTSRGVVIDQLMDGYFARNLAEARRVLGN